MGLFGNLIGDLFGGDAPQIRGSGAFPRAGEVGESFVNLILERLETPAGESAAFEAGSSAIRDQLAKLSAARKGQIGERAVAGGFLDSGQVRESMTDIDRAELEAMSSALRDLFLGLEDRRDRNVLPFLSAASGESLAAQGANQQSELASQQLAQSLFGTAVGAVSGGGLFSAGGIFGE